MSSLTELTSASASAASPMPAMVCSSSSSSEVITTIAGIDEDPVNSAERSETCVASAESGR